PDRSDSEPRATRETPPAGHGTASRRDRRPPRTSPSRAATRPVYSRSGSRGRLRTRPRGSWAISSIRPSPPEDGRDRLRDDRDVEPDRPVLEVGEIEPDQVVEGEARPTRDLPEASHPRKHRIACAMPV